MCVVPLALGAGESPALAKKKAPAAAGRAKEHASKGAKKKRGDSARRASRKGAPKRSRASTGRDDDERGRAMPLSILPGVIHCPPEMVAVAGRVCVDRYETSIVDAQTGAAWPPFYAPDWAKAQQAFELYRERATRAPVESLEAKLAIPSLPDFQVKPKAASAGHVLPQGYLSADEASAACRAAGKRLCSEAEWITACRGEAQRDFPYGESYEQGACNVYRENHPSAMLHHDASRYHDDPRNNLVEFEGKSLLRKTGETPRCGSKWGDDAVMDMVGNLDEWVDDAQGAFVGGFYSRGTRAGCNARIDAHPRGYSDYSTGARCCADPTATPVRWR